MDPKYKDCPDWTDYEFDRAYCKENGLLNVAGDSSRLKNYLEHKFGKLGNVYPEEAIPFPSQGVLVKSSGVIHHVTLAHLKYEHEGVTPTIKDTDYDHGLRIGNPVVFVSIDGAIAREIEGQNSELRDTIRKFKKKLRHVLQFLGFNTLEPSVHGDLVVESLKRHAEQNKTFVEQLSPRKKKNLRQKVLSPMRFQSGFGLRQLHTHENCRHQASYQRWQTATWVAIRQLDQGPDRRAGGVEYPAQQRFRFHTV